MEEELVSVRPGKRAFQAESTVSAKAPREDRSTRFKIFVEDAKPVSESIISSNWKKQIPHSSIKLAQTTFKQ